MPAVPRLLVAFLALVGAFVALVGVAVASLYAAGELALAAVVVIAGLAGVGAGACTYGLLRREVVEEEEDDTLPLVMEEPLIVQPPVRRGPVRVHAMPVADLPPAYVDAVLRGAQARLSAMKAQGQGPTTSSPGH